MERSGLGQYENGTTCKQEEERRIESDMTTGLENHTMPSHRLPSETKLG